ncbi:hypothetical protein PR048_019359 [Dryococelus australis]|uniref:Uncharacterized protein n=1 Tax=Dryococelus australis TaxID=614101 RepID=A0ABQ9H3A5_9NEOP|nr:hypothetical protein PR048_019359 [Dryococelus australis]
MHTHFLHLAARLLQQPHHFLQILPGLGQSFFLRLHIQVDEVVPPHYWVLYPLSYCGPTIGFSTHWAIAAPLSGSLPTELLRLLGRNGFRIVLSNHEWSTATAETQDCRPRHKTKPPIKRGSDLIPEPVTPVFSHVGIVDDAASRRVFSGISRFPPPFHYSAAPHSPQSPSSALKTSLFRAAQISSLFTFFTHVPLKVRNIRTAVACPPMYHPYFPVSPDTSPSAIPLLKLRKENILIRTARPLEVGGGKHLLARLPEVVHVPSHGVVQYLATDSGEQAPVHKPRKHTRNT